MSFHNVFSKAGPLALLIKLEWAMNDKWSEFTVINDTMNNIMTFFNE